MMELRKTRGIKRPLDTLLTSSIAEGSAGVPAVFIETPCWAKPPNEHKHKIPINTIFFIMKVLVNREGKNKKIKRTKAN